MYGDITQIKEKGTAAINPATGEILGYSPLHSVEELGNKIKKARLVQKEWSTTSIKQRVKHIKKIGNFLLDNSHHIARVISEDNGKTQMDAFATEVLPSIMAVDYYCRKVKIFLKEKKLTMSNVFFLHKRSKIIRVPWGVVGIISPWNYPFSIPFYEVIMALLAGNAVILKVATETQMVGKVLEKSIDAANLPDGLFYHVNIPGRLVGDAFIENGIDKLFFTGSVQVGKKMMAKASENLTPVSLELGGNDAMIVCEDANLERAVACVLWAGFSNCGQSCGGIERIYVHEAVYDSFLKILKSGVESLRTGLGTDLEMDMGAITTQAQIDVIKDHIKNAVENGATIYAESPLPKNRTLKNFLPAVVLTDMDHSMKFMREETFGNVVGVQKFSEIEDAITLANDSTVGLTGSVWSRDRKKAESIGRQLQVGVITINDHLTSHGMSETPWGGFKESGIGRCHGEIGFDEMTQSQVIVQDLLHFAKKNPWWHPYSKKVYDGLHGIMYFLFSKNLYNRVRGLFKFLKLVPMMFLKNSQHSKD